MRRLLNWAINVAAKGRRSRKSSNSVPLSAATLTVAAPQAPDWTNDHAQVWASFLSGPVGRDLLLRGRAVAALVGAKACADQFHTSHSAGTANGWYEAMTWLESLSRASRVIDDPKPQEQPEANDKQASTERDALLELYAP